MGVHTRKYPVGHPHFKKGGVIHQEWDDETGVVTVCKVDGEDYVGEDDEPYDFFSLSDAEMKAEKLGG